MPFVIQQDPSGTWRWRLEDRFHRRLADGPCGYAERAECLVAISAVKAAAPAASISDAGGRPSPDLNLPGKPRRRGRRWAARGSRLLRERTGGPGEGLRARPSDARRSDRARRTDAAVEPRLLSGMSTWPATRARRVLAALERTGWRISGDVAPTGRCRVPHGRTWCSPFTTAKRSALACWRASRGIRGSPTKTLNCSPALLGAGFSYPHPPLADCPREVIGCTSAPARGGQKVPLWYNELGGR